MAGVSYLIKLVRDDIAEAEPSCDGGEVRFFGVGQTTHIRLLKQKLVEEAAEYLTATTEDEKLGELVDLLEVIDALAAIDLGIGSPGLLKAKHAKSRERGGFKRGTAMFASTPNQHNQDPQQGEGK